MPVDVQRHKQLSALAATLACALGAGLLFKRSGLLPAPYLFGSMAGTWVLGLSFKVLRPFVGVPRWLQVSVATGLGVLIGAMFTPAVVHFADQWLRSIAVMLLTTVVATLGGYLFLTRVRSYDGKLAILCCLPGGQAEVVMLSRDLVDQDYVVSLCHLARLVMVLLLVPLVLMTVEGSGAVERSHELVRTLPGIRDLTAPVLAMFLLLAAGGYALGRAIRLPIPHLLGPLLASAAAHLAGLIEIPRISEFMVLAQITIGAAVGANMARVPAERFSGYLADALVNGLLIIALYALSAFALSEATGGGFLNSFLAFVPGGVYQVTLLTLLFGLDIAFVAAHQTVRVLIVFISIPLIATWFGKVPAKRKAREAAR